MCSTSERTEAAAAELPSASAVAAPPQLSS
jgi:hypothetical protein